MDETDKLQIEAYNKAMQIAFDLVMKGAAREFVLGVITLDGGMMSFTSKNGKKLAGQIYRNKDE